jgi:hypothetical protein
MIIVTLVKANRSARTRRGYTVRPMNMFNLFLISFGASYAVLYLFWRGKDDGDSSSSSYMSGGGGGISSSLIMEALEHVDKSTPDF